LKLNASWALAVRGSLDKSEAGWHVLRTGQVPMEPGDRAQSL